MSAEIISADFTPAFLDLVKDMVKQIGQVGAVEYLIIQDEHPSYARAIVRFAIKSSVAR